MQLGMIHKKNLIKVLIVFLITLGAVFGIWFKWFRVRYDQYGIPSAPVSYEFVSSKPEAKLFYPNGKIYAPFGSGQESLWPEGTGYGVAFAGAVMVTTDSPEQIYAWYRDWLLSHGWQYSDYQPGHGGSQSSLQDYVKNGQKWDSSRESFYIAINNPKLIIGAVGNGKQIPANTTVFEFDYIIKGDTP